MRLKWRTWTFLARSSILQNYLWISDKTSTCEPENDLWKKSWRSHNGDVVQSYPASCWIGKSLSFLWKVDGTNCMHNKLLIYTKNVSYYYWKLWWSSFVMYFQYFLHTKHPILTLRKWELIFLCIENENSEYKICFPSQYTHMCTIWGHLNKLFHDSGHDLAHLAWKPWNSYMISHFWEGFSTIFAIVQVYYFSSQLGHITWHNAKVLHFLIFFWISYAWFKMRSKWLAWTFLARGWILQNYLWISGKTSTYEPGNDFF
jgi:hypothetical protein